MAPFGRTGGGSCRPSLDSYDGAGGQLWIQQLGTNDGDGAGGAATDGAGGVFVSGGTRGSLGGPSSGNLDAWVAHYDGAGNQLWIQQLGTSDSETVRAAAPDGLGGVYVTGETGGNFGGTNAG